MPRSFASRFSCLFLAFSVIPTSLSQPRLGASAAALPSKETLTYNIEWRLIYAGAARLSLEPKGSNSEAKLHLESGGLVSKLYKVDDNYTVDMDEHFCGIKTELDAVERNRHHETKVEYDRARGKAIYVERDVLKNATIKTAEADIQGCVSDIVGGLYKIRMTRLEPGQSAQIALSDGKKTVSARIDAKAREQIKTKAGTFNTIRYEAFVFNGVLYARKAQLLIWLSDDARKVPAQIRLRMSFPIGSITLELVKEEHS
jgi:uncharacterized protein DUF3108